MDGEAGAGDGGVSGERNIVLRAQTLQQAMGRPMRLVVWALVYAVLGRALEEPDMTYAAGVVGYIAFWDALVAAFCTRRISLREARRELDRIEREGT